MSSELFKHLDTTSLKPALPLQEAAALAAQLAGLCRFEVYASSVAAAQQSLFFLGRSGVEKRLALLTADPQTARGFQGQSSQVTVSGRDLTVLSCPADETNAAALRSILAFLVPKTLGLLASVGCGDRLGMATPGHVRAVRKSRMAPIFAQQSIRENARTGRTPQQVMDEALWGIFQEGWRDGFGADADHLKTKEDIDSCVAAGYTFYTIDPGEHVDNEADTTPIPELRRKAAALPWREIETGWEDLRQRLCSRPVDLGEFSLQIGEEELLRAAVKYGRVVAHTFRMFRHLEGVIRDQPFELEMSVDETESVTTVAEHVYIASELRRLGVRWVSLAPRYVGTFEKGVDYIGDLAEFERSFARHVAVSRTFGPYKLSLHSGSDKFRIYPIASRVAGGLVHLKTAGTSYLEAVRAIAESRPALFREIVAFAVDRYPEDRASYHVSAEIAEMPEWQAWEDSRLSGLVDDFHGREILHVTFGSVLNNGHLRNRFFESLRTDEEVYYRKLEAHFDKHLSPFMAFVRDGRSTAR